MKKQDQEKTRRVYRTSGCRRAKMGNGRDSAQRRQIVATKLILTFRRKFRIVNVQRRVVVVRNVEGDRVEMKDMNSTCYAFAIRQPMISACRFWKLLCHFFLSQDRVVGGPGLET